MAHSRPASSSLVEPAEHPAVGAEDEVESVFGFGSEVYRFGKSFESQIREACGLEDAFDARRIAHPERAESIGRWRRQFAANAQRHGYLSEPSVLGERLPHEQGEPAAGPVLEFEQLLKVSFAENGTKSDALKTLAGRFLTDVSTRIFSRIK